MTLDPPYVPHMANKCYIYSFIFTSHLYICASQREDDLQSKERSQVVEEINDV